MHKAILALLVGLLWLIAGRVAAPMQAAPSAQILEHPALAQLRGLRGAEFERAWLTRMLEQHQAAIDLAALVWEQGSHDDLKSLAQGMIVTHSQENAELGDDLNTWYGQPPPEGRLLALGTNFAKLQGLRDDAFDREWLMQMQSQQTLAVDLAALVPDRATHAELKDLAARLTQSRRDESAKMGGWFKTWYGVDLPAASAFAWPASLADVPRWAWIGLAGLALLIIAGGQAVRRARDRFHGLS
jgi:uncharacterized protein (DUF305 family)